MMIEYFVGPLQIYEYTQPQLKKMSKLLLRLVKKSLLNHLRMIHNTMNAEDIVHHTRKFVKASTLQKGNIQEKHKRVFEKAKGISSSNSREKSPNKETRMISNDSVHDQCIQFCECHGFGHINHTECPNYRSVNGKAMNASLSDNQSESYEKNVNFMIR